MGLGVDPWVVVLDEDSAMGGFARKRPAPAPYPFPYRYPYLSNRIADFGYA